MVRAVVVAPTLRRAERQPAARLQAEPARAVERRAGDGDSVATSRGDAEVARSADRSRRRAATSGDKNEQRRDERNRRRAECVGAHHGPLEPRCLQYAGPRRTRSFRRFAVRDGNPVGTCGNLNSSRHGRPPARYHPVQDGRRIRGWRAQRRSCRLVLIALAAPIALGIGCNKTFGGGSPPISGAGGAAAKADAGSDRPVVDAGGHTDASTSRDAPTIDAHDAVVADTAMPSDSGVDGMPSPRWMLSLVLDGAPWDATQFTQGMAVDAQKRVYVGDQLLRSDRRLKAEPGVLAELGGLDLSLSLAVLAGD